MKTDVELDIGPDTALLFGIKHQAPVYNPDKEPMKDREQAIEIVKEELESLRVRRDFADYREPENMQYVEGMFDAVNNLHEQLKVWHECLTQLRKRSKS
jgi:hypothetical protein